MRVHFLASLSTSYPNYSYIMVSLDILPSTTNFRAHAVVHQVGSYASIKSRDKTLQGLGSGGRGDMMNWVASQSPTMPLILKTTPTLKIFWISSCTACACLHDHIFHAAMHGYRIVWRLQWHCVLYAWHSGCNYLSIGLGTVYVCQMYLFYTSWSLIRIQTKFAFIQSYLVDPWVAGYIPHPDGD